MAQRKKKSNSVKWRRIVAKTAIRLIVLSLLVITFLVMFNVRKVVITGTKSLSSQDIMYWLGRDEKTANGLYTYLKYNYTDFEMMDAMDNVRVSLINPWTVKVDVKEKDSVGYILCDGKAVSFAPDGVIMEISNVEPSGIPKIEGMEITDPKRYKMIELQGKESKVLKRLDELRRTLKACELLPDAIYMGEEGIELFFGKIRVMLGTTNYEKRIEQIRPIMEQLQERDDFERLRGTIHLEIFKDDYSTIRFVKKEEGDYQPDLSREPINPYPDENGEQPELGTEEDE